MNIESFDTKEDLDLNDIACLNIEYLENFPKNKNLESIRNLNIINLYYASNKEIILYPYERVYLATGIKIKFPYLCQGQITSRESLVFQKGLVVMNSPAIINNGNSEEIKVMITNLDVNSCLLAPYTKIAELSLIRILKPQFENIYCKKKYNKQSYKECNKFHDKFSYN